MIINHNMSAMFAQRQGGVNELHLAKNIEKLSSAQRINRACDDASGLAVSEKMRSQIRGLNAVHHSSPRTCSHQSVSAVQPAETSRVNRRNAKSDCAKDDT